MNVGEMPFHRMLGGLRIAGTDGLENGLMPHVRDPTAGRGLMGQFPHMLGAFERELQNGEQQLVAGGVREQQMELDVEFHRLRLAEVFVRFFFKDALQRGKVGRKGALRCEGRDSRFERFAQFRGVLQLDVGRFEHGRQFSGVRHGVEHGAAPSLDPFDELFGFQFGQRLAYGGP